MIVASTFPAKRGDGTPGFVWDLAEVLAEEFPTMVLVPRVRGAPSEEHHRDLRIVRFPYFFKKWEDLAQGAIIENLKSRPSRWLQVLPFMIAEARAIRRTVRRFRPTVIHAHWIVPQGVTTTLAAPQIPRVVTTLGGDVYALNGTLMRWLKRRILERACAVTSVNSDMKGRLISLGADSSSTHVIPMGTRTQSPEPSTSQPMPGRVLFAGRLVEKKGLEFLLKAVSGLATQQWNLEIVGDGPLRSNIERAAAPLGPKVQLRGTLASEELHRAMRSAEIFVLPSIPADSGDQDGLPVVLLEAMSQRCAIVASALPGITDVIHDNKTGLLVPPGDSDAIRLAIDRLLSNPKMRNDLAESAARAAKHFTVEALAPRYSQILEECSNAQPETRSFNSTPPSSE